MILEIILSAVLGQQTFQDVPYVYAPERSVFRTIINAASNSKKRILIIGDSQETNPGGAGNIYIPRLNYELYLRTGNVPETPLVNVSTNGSLPPADFLVRCSNPVGAAQVPSNINPNRLPPGFNGGQVSTLNNSAVYPNEFYGFLSELQQDAHDINLLTELPIVEDYFDTSTVCGEVFAFTDNSSGEIAVRILPNNSNVPNYFLSASQVFTSNIGLESATPNVKKFIFGPLLYNNRKYIQAEVYGTNPNKFTQILGVRYFNPNAVGWGITSFSAGGYSTSTLLSNHNKSLPAILALEPSVIFIMYGANDGGLGCSATSFKNNLRLLIQYLRSNEETFPIPIVIIPDAYSANYVNDNWKQYVVAAKELADELPMVAVLNACRRLYDQGWNEIGYPTYLGDGVHYNVQGAFLKASVDIELFYSLASECWYDFDNNGLVNQQDLSILIDAVSGYNPLNIITDINEDGISDQGDVYYLINKIAADC